MNRNDTKIVLVGIVALALFGGYWYSIGTTLLDANKRFSHQETKLVVVPTEPTNGLPEHITAGAAY